MKNKRTGIPTIIKKPYHGWKNCYYMSQGALELIAVTDIGPRVIHLSLDGGKNFFHEVKETLGKQGGREWKPYGGHRLWHAPEAMPRSYEPDNEAMELVKAERTTLLLRQRAEKGTGIQKEIELSLLGDGVKIVHRLFNRGIWPVRLSPWVLSVMRPGGTCILPLPPRGTHPEMLAPSNTITLWHFTDMSDPRWTWGRKYILLRQDARSNPKNPQKVGAWTPDAWIAYANQGQLFVKILNFDRGATYPDKGCSVETFTNHEILEVESLGPLVELEPGASVDHTERWFVFNNVSVPRNDIEVDRFVLPYVHQALVSCGKALHS